MSRTPRAAKTLINQVRERLNRKPDSKAGLETAVASDEGDGLGVHRAFTFDKTASKGLADLLNTLNDPRIESVSESGGQATVIFSPRTIADDPKTFDLDGAGEALASASEPPVEDPKD